MIPRLLVLIFPSALTTGHVWVPRAQLIQAAQFSLVIFSFFLLSCLLILHPTSSQATLDNPIVPNGHINPKFTHGSYPSPEVGDGNWTHVGVDIGADCGSDVYAFADGEVVEVIKDQTDWRYGKGLGFALRIKHPIEENTWTQKPFYTVYLHLSGPPLVNVGDRVIGGETVIGKVGKTPSWSHCHTHFEVRYFEGIEGFWHPQWGERTESGMRLNIYGRGDQSDSPLLTTDWENPEHLFGEIGERIRGTASPEIVDVAENREMVKRAQELLVQVGPYVAKLVLGPYAGKEIYTTWLANNGFFEVTNGLYNAQTKNAIEIFQKTQRLPIDGKVSANLILSLRKVAEAHAPKSTDTTTAGEDDGIVPEQTRLQKVKRKQAEICLAGNPAADTKWLVEEHTEAAAKIILGNSILCQSDGLIELLKFDKTDGRSAELFGVKIYELWYIAEIEFIKDVWWSAAINFDSSNFRAFERTPDHADNLLIKMRNYPKNTGDKQKISGSILFERTERGWWGKPAKIRLMQ